MAKSNTCDDPNLREASILSGFQEHFAMFDINNYEEGAPMPPDLSLNPGGKGLKSPDTPYSQKSQVPSLPVTLGREEPDPNPGQIAKSNTCDVPNRRKTSTLSGYQKHFAVFDINKFSTPQAHLTLFHT